MNTEFKVKLSHEDDKTVKNAHDENEWIILLKKETKWLRNGDVENSDILSYLKAA